MTSRLRFLAPLLTTLLFAAGCGSDGPGGESASSSSDPNQLLRTTFQNTGKIKSGAIDLSVKVDADESAGLGGPVSVSLKGPFQSQGENKLAKFAFQGAVSGAGQNLTGGLTFTGEKAFVSVMGTSYEVSPVVTSQFLAGYEEAIKQQKAQGGKSGLSLRELGVDPEKWLTNPTNEGESKVGDTEVIKLTGTANVEQIVNDIDTLSQKAGSLGVPSTAGVPDQLTPEQKKAAVDAVKDVKIEVYTGAEDQILRRLLVNGTATADGSTATIVFDLKFTDVNQDQDFKAPQGAKPFADLVKLFDESGLGDLGLGAFGGATGGGDGGASGGSGSDPGEVPTVDPDALNNVDKYADCIEQAGGDADKARECADLLTG